MKRWLRWISSTTTCTALEKAVGKAKADELLKPFDDLLEKAKDTIAQTAAAAADKLLRKLCWL